MTAPAAARPTRTRPTTCYECDANCGFELDLDATGEALAVRGPDCPRGQAQLERQYHPERLLHPLRRSGPRGSGEFERISWDQALDTIAAGLHRVKRHHGAPAVGFFAGYTKEARPQLQRLAHAFGSPNFLTEAGCCFSATMVAEKLTFGYKIKSTSTVESPHSRCLLIWSTNPTASVPPFEQHPFARRKRGRALILVDPRRTEIARLADIHLQIRPGTDGALALGFHREIFARGWQDRTFLDEWASGLDAFLDYVQAFTPERVGAICGIDPDALRRAVALYATSAPAQLVLSPTATVQHGNGFQNHRAVILLAAVTGNLDREGGNRFFNDKVHPRRIDLFDRCRTQLPPRIGEERYPIWSRYWPAAQSMLMADCILEGRPQPLRGLLAMGINTTMWPNSRRMEQALASLHFFATVDFFHNPATSRADIVLPAATSLERSALIAYPGCAYRGEVRYRRAALEPRGEARADAKIFLDIGVRLGMGKLFWHGDPDASWAEAAAGLPAEVRRRIYAGDAAVEVHSAAIDELVEQGFLEGDRLYRLKGFPTASGKVEFDSRELCEAGHEGLPVYREPLESPVSTPELARDFPLVLTTGGRQRWYTHSQQRNIACLRARDPVPRAQIHPLDARARGIETGSRVRVRSPRGGVLFTAEVTEDVKRGVVHCFHGWNEANVNELTDDRALDPISGFPAFKSLLCEVERLDGSADG